VGLTLISSTGCIARFHRDPDTGNTATGAKGCSEDIAILTGGESSPKRAGSQAERSSTSSVGAWVVITKDNFTTVVDGAGDTERSDQPDPAPSSNRLGLRPRSCGQLAKLAGGVAVIKVSAASPGPGSRRRSIASRTSGATRAARGGSCRGGGVTLVHERPPLTYSVTRWVTGRDRARIMPDAGRADEGPGWRRTPAPTISIVVDKVLTRGGSFGYNA